MLRRQKHVLSKSTTPFACTLSASGYFVTPKHCKTRETQNDKSTRLKTLTSLNKEVGPFFLSDNSIWGLPSVSSLSDYSIWRS